ncbi:THO complex subunit 1 [Monascus purpureus]|uniref:THO complex subunit 1 n=1 Tax=Monascus purpureus TaxID=5098 RepID=A0A507QSM8_MONPU|nr:THO complex subunit 1 [Monascus purpureus]BDD54944.1 hypothetical protein MAP00_000511 [Monascus purpureus]
MADVDIEAVNAYRSLVSDLLERATQAKPDKHIEPPLTEAQLGESIWVVKGADANVVEQLAHPTRHAAAEIAFREKFYSLLATTSIDETAFIHVWNLLDIVSIFSDNEQCEPGLIFWLIEELLDSQTIDGCRKVFDYLESRREINTKKHFKQKSLIILRSCNELLRRLSRAEDTVFCGRVFIFLFQSFPLGDKSSVNLRGEYHTENVTTYDDISRKPEEEHAETDVAMTDASEASTAAEVQSGADSGETPKLPKLTVSGQTDRNSKTNVDLDVLYPLFWSLQAYFSAPTKVFDPQHFTSFKTGLEATLSTFKSINTDLENQNTSKASEDIRKSTKRKRTADGQEFASSFNPKYLTSRDLFDLEVSDTAFRRHVLVQALILLDFMLSLTPKAKARLSNLTNKSVLYGFVLNDEDAKWATDMRKRIEEYLQQGIGGKFYYRMVDTVLSRDKNWVRWKAEGCPPIERPAVSVTEYLGARERATKIYANKRLRSSPAGALDLKFLLDDDSLKQLKEPVRSSIPDSESLVKSIANDDLDLEMAQTKEETDNISRAKTSKTWCVLRLSLKSKLSAFEKIDDGKNIRLLVETPQATEGVPRPPTEGENAAGQPDHGSANVEKQSTAVEGQTPEMSKIPDDTETKQTEAA